MKRVVKVLSLIIPVFLSVLVSAQSIEVSLDVMYRDAGKITRGMPVVLDLSIISEIGVTRDEVMYSLPDSLWDDPEILERLDSVFEPVLFVRTEEPWFRTMVFIIESEGQKSRFTLQMYVIRPFPPDRESFDHSEPLHIYYGIDPDVTRGWKPGVVKISAGLPVLTGNDTVWSKPLILNVDVRTAKKPDDYSAEEKYKLARYWLLRDQCLKAEPFARILYAMDSTSFRNTTILAEVEECKGDLSRALELFINSLEKYEGLPAEEPEPPLLLMHKIEELQERLNSNR